MYRPIKRSLVGNPISTAMAHHERLNNKTALAVFSSDALSSVAYSTEAILVVLVAEAGAGANGYLVPIVTCTTRPLSSSRPSSSSTPASSSRACPIICKGRRARV